MKTAQQLEEAFGVYFDEMARCDSAGCYWALLHLLVSMPDVCAALEVGHLSPVGQRYMDWCVANFPSDPRLTPADRYQMRNRVLHEGSTLTTQPHSQYTSISFVDPASTNEHVHLLVSGDGNNLAVNIKDLADDTRMAMRKWFAVIESDLARNQCVEQNLPRLARRQTKVSDFNLVTEDGHQLTSEDGSSIVIPVAYPTTSST
jgi:hypothetical protein